MDRAPIDIAPVAPFPYPSSFSAAEFAVPPATGHDFSLSGPSRARLHELGRRLRRLRERVGVSQEALAALAGVSQSAVSRLETGRSPGAPFVVVVRLGVALGRAAAGERQLIGNDERRLLEAFEALGGPWLAA